jgi:3'(2'), 5'-bisphosphate nucleotidase
MNDHQVSALLAEEAGQLLLQIREERPKEADRLANDLLIGRLAELRPDDAVLSEESADSPRRLACDRVWIIDPLDGTREYNEAGRQDWAVHVALAVEGVPVAGAVALPAAGLVLDTASPPPRPTHRPHTPRLVVSRSRPSEFADRLQAHLDAELLPMGSAGAKAMAVVRGAADVYAHSGGQYEWDSCAPVAVAAAAGLHVSRLDGSPLVYNRSDPYLPDVLVCIPELVDQVLSITCG